MDNKDVFVIMPFSSTATCSESEWAEIYENVFKPAIEECGYSCERAMSMTGSLIKSIVEKLKFSKIVLADVTDRNPNVFYELGVRHSLSKRTVIVAQGSNHIPSDLLGYWYITYGTSPGQVTKFKKEIKRLISEIEKNPNKSDSPISDFLEHENLHVSQQTNVENIKRLTALHTEFTGNIIALTELSENRFSELFLSYDCLKLFLQTMYVDLGPEILRDLYEMRNKFTKIERARNNPYLDRVQFLIYLKKTIDEIKQLADKILLLRNRLAQGQYKESDSISTMVWSFNSPSLEKPGCIELSKEW